MTEWTVDGKTVTKEEFNAWLDRINNLPPERICDLGEVSTVDLKPCPFCGGHILAAIDGSTYQWWTIECGECQATCGDVSRRGDDAPAELRKAWNTRNGLEP